MGRQFHVCVRHLQLVHLTDIREPQRDSSCMTGCLILPLEAASAQPTARSVQREKGTFWIERDSKRGRVQNCVTARRTPRLERASAGPGESECEAHNSLGAGNDFSLGDAPHVHEEDGVRQEGLGSRLRGAEME